MSTTNFVTFISFDKEKSIRFPQILSKLSIQLSQYIDIDQGQILTDLNESTENEKLTQNDNYNLWQFEWISKQYKMVEFLKEHPYIGTRLMRIFFNTKEYTKQDLCYEVLQKMPINNVRRLSNAGNQHQGQNPFWKSTPYQKNAGDLKIQRNYSNQASSLQQKQKEPESYEEYQQRIEQMQEKIINAKNSNKELKETNQLLEDSLLNLKQTIEKQGQNLKEVEQLIDAPLNQLLPPQEKIEQNEEKLSSDQNSENYSNSYSNQQQQEK